LKKKTFRGMELNKKKDKKNQSGKTQGSMINM